jgi:hypothetical protein
VQIRFQASAAALQLAADDGRRHCIGMVAKPKRLQRSLISGADAHKPENILKMFEATKRRAATRAQVASLRATLRRQRARKPPRRKLASA